MHSTPSKSFIATSGGSGGGGATGGHGSGGRYRCGRGDYKQWQRQCQRQQSLAPINDIARLVVVELAPELAQELNQQDALIQQYY